MKLGCSTLLYGGFDLPTTLKGISDAGYAAIYIGVEFAHLGAAQDIDPRRLGSAKHSRHQRGRGAKHRRRVPGDAHR